MMLNRIEYLSSSKEFLVYSQERKSDGYELQANK